MGAVYFSPTQCNELQNIATQAYFPKLGFNRKMPKEIIYGPPEYGGWGERDLFCQLAMDQTKIFLGHIRNKDETGDLLLTNLEL